VEKGGGAHCSRSNSLHNRLRKEGRGGRSPLSTVFSLLLALSLVRVNPRYTCEPDTERRWHGPRGEQRASYLAEATEKTIAVVERRARRYAALKSQRRGDRGDGTERLCQAWRR
jgi:hypothetical protein